MGIENPKYEARNSKQIRMTQAQKSKRTTSHESRIGRVLSHLLFSFVTGAVLGRDLSMLTEFVFALAGRF